MSRPRGVPPVALTIAGSDPSGGAGIQADLKAFSALGAYGCAVLTALTAQNTRGVTGALPVPAGFVRDQLETLAEDVRIDTVKIGMVADAGVARAVAAHLREHRPPFVVLDPVMVATSGDRLLEREAEAVVRDELVPLADLVTPNLAEAAALLAGPTACDLAAVRALAAALQSSTGRWVLVKGGHLDPAGGPAVDVLAAPDGTLTELRAERVDTRNTHGTGCTLSAAIAALVALDPDGDVVRGVRRAKDYLTGALRAADGLSIGRADATGRPGHGPVHHFAGIWPDPPATGLRA